jgi:acetyl-coenzyme A synthetase (EC 6.2.1.1)
MEHCPVFPVSQRSFKYPPYIDAVHYQELYQHSINDPDTFWRTQAQTVDWMRPFSRVKNVSFNPHDFRIRWFEDGTLNVCVNCVDRHLPERADKVALLFEGNQPGHGQKITYQALYHHVCRFANVLKAQGITKGDTVVLYMPMIPEVIYAMLACARIGVIHSVVFGGFSAHALAGRIDDCEAKLVITADAAHRGSKAIPLKETVDAALRMAKGNSVRRVIVINHTDSTPAMQAGRDAWYRDLSLNMEDTCPAVEMNAEDPLFILYTSGSTGTPKGVLHTSGGYLVYAAVTHKHIFDYHEDDIYWCTADAGWITGHSYVVYGPLANGATSLIYEGTPHYPTPSRFWEIIDQHQVTLFYTAPTAIRALMREGNQQLHGTTRQSLRILGSVGEPLNPEAWSWYHDQVGQGRCPVVDTWWQTETGGILLTPLPGVTDLKPGSVSKPFFGIEPALLDDQGQELHGAAVGNLVIKDSWPGQMRTLYKDHARFIETYFSRFNNVYVSGDGARRDADGDYWVTGRVDDVINVSGHRLGTAEIEAALNTHAQVAESAVVGVPHAIKGEGIYAFVLMKTGTQVPDNIEQHLIQQVRDEIGPIATLDHVMVVPELPKTRSGKIMRRVLRKLATHQLEELGDISTLANPEAVDKIAKLLIPGKV